MNIRVSNLPSDVTEQDVTSLFASYGLVEAVQVVRDKHSGITEGTAYVMMPSDSEAERAIAGLDGTDFEGNVLSVHQADAADFPSGDYW